MIKSDAVATTFSVTLFALHLESLTVILVGQLTIYGCLQHLCGSTSRSAKSGDTNVVEVETADLEVRYAPHPL